MNSSTLPGYVSEGIPKIVCRSPNQTSRPLLTSESQPTDALASIARPSLSLASERACSARFRSSISVLVPYHLAIRPWVALRHRTNQKPAKASVGLSHPRFCFARYAFGQDATPRRDQLVQIFGMNGGLPPPTLRLFRCETCVLKPGLIAELYRAVRKCTPNELRNDINCATEVRLGVMTFRPELLSSTGWAGSHRTSTSTRSIRPRTNPIRANRNNTISFPKHKTCVKERYTRLFSLRAIEATGQ